MTMVWTLTGASPVSVTRLFEAVMTLVVVILNAAASSPVTVVRMLLRAVEMKVLVAVGVPAAMPLLMKARYLASSIGSTFAASHGPVTISLSERR